MLKVGPSTCTLFATLNHLSTKWLEDNISVATFIFSIQVNLEEVEEVLAKEEYIYL